MTLENITVTATIDGEPVMVLVMPEGESLLVGFLASVDPTGKCRVVKLDPEKYELGIPSFLHAYAAAENPAK